MNKTLLLIGALIAIGALMMPILMQLEDVFADGNEEESGGNGNAGHGQKSCGRGQSSSHNKHCR